MLVIFTHCEQEHHSHADYPFCVSHEVEFNRLLK